LKDSLVASLNRLKPARGCGLRSTRKNAPKEIDLQASVSEEKSIELKTILIIPCALFFSFFFPHEQSG